MSLEAVWVHPGQMTGWALRGCREAETEAHFRSPRKGLLGMIRVKSESVLLVMLTRSVKQSSYSKAVTTTYMDTGSMLLLWGLLISAR